MTDLSATPFTRRLDELVESARAARDRAFNTLDAVNRQTKSACAALAGEARPILDAAAERAHRPPEDTERENNRFHPADDDSSDSETDYPDTWLR